MAPGAGLEPATIRLTVGRSTTELPRIDSAARSLAEQESDCPLFDGEGLARVDSDLAVGRLVEAVEIALAIEQRLVSLGFVLRTSPV